MKQKRKGVWKRWAWLNKDNGDLTISTLDSTTRKKALAGRDENEKVIRVEIREI